MRVGAHRTGSDARDELTGAKTTDDVDVVFRKYMKNGDVPNFIKKDFWVWVPINENGHSLELRVLGDYWGVGTNTDYLRAGKTSEGFAQEVADYYDAILPSQKLLRDVEAQANERLAFIPVQKGGGADDSVEAVFKANDLANAALEKIGATTTDGALKIGYRKSYVVRPNLDGQYIAIYGGRWNTAGGLVQPTSGHAHTEGYSDYSHGLTLISRKAKLDGVDVDLRDVFLSKDPSVSGLVSDEGSFNPRWPSTGGGTARFSIDGGGGGEDLGGGGGGEGGGVATYSAFDSSLAGVQRALMSLGYDLGATGADGKPGPKTSAAVVKFKKDHGLAPEDDAIDAPFREALASATRSPLATRASGGVTTPVMVAIALAAVGVGVWIFA